jgi:HAMP domain-containing protein
MTTDRSQGLSNLTGGAASIAAAFLNAPANVAARVLSAGINSLNNIADTSSSVATQFSGRPAIVAGLGAFNRQLERDASALSALANVTQGWIGYDSQVIGAAQNLAKGDLSGWASALGLGATPSNAASTSFQLFNTHLSG